MIRWNLLYLQANPTRAITAGRLPKRYYAMPALAAVEAVADSLAIDVDLPGDDSRLILFVQPAAGRVLDDVVRRVIADALRMSLSPRFVPEEIVAVAAVPPTLLS